MFYICKKHFVVRLYLFLIVTPNIVKLICIKESMLPLKFTCTRVECDWILDCMKNSMVVIQQKKGWGTGKGNSNPFFIQFRRQVNTIKSNTQVCVKSFVSIWGKCKEIKNEAEKNIKLACHKQ